jgi:nitrogen fixation NifU-like protein
LDRPFAELDSLYRDVVLDHYRSPRGREALPSPDVQHDGFNPICGDEVHVALEMDDGRVRSVQIKSRGCAISVASGSMLAEILPGMTREQIERLSEVFRRMIHGEDPPADLELGDLEALHGVAKFPVRVKCALLPWMTLKEALRAFVNGRTAPAKSTSTEEPPEETA